MTTHVGVALRCRKARVSGECTPRPTHALRLVRLLRLSVTADVQRRSGVEDQAGVIECLL
jgi:hypothetical protein